MSDKKAEIEKRTKNLINFLTRQGYSREDFIQKLSILNSLGDFLEDLGYSESKNLLSEIYSQEIIKIALEFFDWKILNGK